MIYNKNNEIVMCPHYQDGGWSEHLEFRFSDDFLTMPPSILDEIKAAIILRDFSKLNTVIKRHSKSNEKRVGNRQQTRMQYIIIDLLYDMLGASIITRQDVKIFSVFILEHDQLHYV